MPPNDTRYAREWLVFAEKDLGRVTRTLRENDPEIAGFFLQQAVEKFLKAFLLSQEWKLIRTHDLVALLDDANTHDATLNHFRLVCHDISLFYPLSGLAVFCDINRWLVRARCARFLARRAGADRADSCDVTADRPVKLRPDCPMRYPAW